MTGELSEPAFLRLRAMLDSAAGLCTDGSRRTALGSVVRQLREETGAPSAEAYLDLAASSPTELQRLVEASVVGETMWLRTPPQIEALATVVIPGLAADSEGRPLRVWSAGCSTGEEAWTLALLAVEAGVDAEITGTDISHRALTAARAGRYGERSLAGVSAARRAAYLRRLDGEPPEWAVGPELRGLVQFQAHDLVHERPPFPDGAVDLVVCRNVSIYFARETTRAVVDRFADVLTPGGVLVMGHAETLWQVTDRLAVTRVGDAFVYRRPVARVPPARLPSGGLRSAAAATGAAHDPGSAGSAQNDPVIGATAGWSSAVRSALAAGQLDEALQQAQKRVVQAPSDADANYLLGLVLSTMGRDEDAVAALRKATYAEPGHGLAHFLLATSLSVIGAQAAAQASYAAAATALDRYDRAGEPPPELDGRSVPELAGLCRTLASASLASS